MDEERPWVSFLKTLFSAFAYVFTLAIITMTFVSMLFIRLFPDQVYAGQIPIMSGDNMAGLSFSTILQFAAFSLVMAFVITLLFSQHLFPKLRYLHRVFLLSFIAALGTFLFGLIFRWFPTGEPLALFSIAGGILTCFGFTFLFSMIGNRLEGKKYDRLLANYKARRKGES